ncbi:MAG: folate family ECF transporter S component [Oscillospiraceae bacterium]|nr:folate family ECF transporter S component [Oscillospiraceae bacterium]
MQKNKHTEAVYRLAFAAMLVAVSCILSFGKFAVGPNVNVTFFFLPIAIGAMCLGALPAAAIGAVADILGCLIMPTGPYFPGFTLNAVITGAVYGIFFHKRKPKLWQIILARLVLMVVVDLVLTPLWLHLLYSTPLVWAFWVQRFIKCAIVCPLEIVFVLIVNSAVYRILNKSDNTKK